jgi:hypothetical protein
MAKFDIPVPEKLKEVLAPPRCLDFKLPPPQKLTVQLPSGASLTALNDLGKGIPNDCSLIFSLMLQIGPLLGSMECLLKMLKVIKTLSDIVNNLPLPPFKAIKDFGEAVAELAPCFLMLTPAGMIPFVRDILCLILKLLRCLIGQLKTIVQLLSGLTIQLESARAAGNDDLVATLECSRENALTSIQHLLQAFGPVSGLFDLAGPFMSIAGVQAIQLPELSNRTDIDSINETLGTLQAVVDTVQGVVDTLGGCPQ